MTMLVRMVAALLCCAVTAPAVANAKAKRSPTRIDVVEAAIDSIRAELHSPFKGCLRERTVSLVDPGTGAVLQTTTSARDGGFSIGLADVPAGIAALQVVAAPEDIGSRVCEPDSADLAFDAGTLTGGAGGGAFGGVLQSSVDACEPGRMISLYEISSDPVFVGWNLTDASGAWTIAQAGGTYQAQAEPAIVGGGDAFAYCRPLTSPAWSYADEPEV
jgi:hypothetical protein